MPPLIYSSIAPMAMFIRNLLEEGFKSPPHTPLMVYGMVKK